MSSRSNSSVRSRCGQCGGNHNLSYYCSSVNTFKRVKDASRMKFLSGLQSKTSQHGSVLLRSDTEIISQPKDGSCLFSSLSSLIGQGTTSSSLRATVVDVIRNDSNRIINGDSISTWIYCDVSKSAHQYAEWIKKSSSWGGGIESSSCGMDQLRPYGSARSNLSCVSVRLCVCPVCPVCPVTNKCV